MTAQPRFIVLAQGSQYIVHDREDGSDSTPMTRYSSAAHLCAQWNRQAVQEAALEAELMRSPRLSADAMNHLEQQ